MKNYYSVLIGSLNAVQFRISKHSSYVPKEAIKLR